MKIGEIEERKIPAGQNVQCENGCPDKAVRYFNGTPLCAECLREERLQMWNRDENSFVNIDGARIYFEVVQRIS
jgi:hypothetical protein